MESREGKKEKGVVSAEVHRVGPGKTIAARLFYRVQPRCVSTVGRGGDCCQRGAAGGDVEYLGWEGAGGRGVVVKSANNKSQRVLLFKFKVFPILQLSLC